MSDIAVGAAEQRTSDSERMGFFAILWDVWTSVRQVSVPTAEPVAAPVGGFVNPLAQLADRKAAVIYRYVRTPLAAEYAKSLTEDELKFMRSLSLYERGVLRSYFQEELMEWVMGKELFKGFRRFGEHRRADDFVKPDEFGVFCYFMTRSRAEKEHIFLNLPKETRPLLRAYGIDTAEELGERHPKEVLEEIRRINRQGFDAIKALKTPKPRMETMSEFAARREKEFAEIDREFEAGRREAASRLVQQYFGPDGSVNS